MELDNRRRLLLVMKILEEHSDDQPGLTMDRIIRKLESVSDNQSFDRKAIYKDIDAIKEIANISVDRKLGVSVYKVQRKVGFTKDQIESLIMPCFLPDLFLHNIKKL